MFHTWGSVLIVPTKTATSKPTSRLDDSVGKDLEPVKQGNAFQRPDVLL